MKQRRRERYTCPGCGFTTQLIMNVRAYCECNKQAPFKLVPESVSRAVDKVLGKQRSK